MIGRFAMNIRHALVRPLRRGGALAAAAVLASAGIAFASDALSGASYTGHLSGEATATISFKVSTNGKRVVDLSAGTPFKCGGGCGGVPSVTNGSARISKSGKFTLTYKLTDPGSTKAFGTDTISGTFHKHGVAKGTTASHFTTGNFGKTVSWTATG
jgi:hypothetical protein